MPTDPPAKAVTTSVPPLNRRHGDLGADRVGYPFEEVRGQRRPGAADRAQTRQVVGFAGPQVSALREAWI